MTISVVMRLVPGDLIQGRIVGEVQIVETGERRLVRTVEELLAFLSDQGVPEKEERR